MSYNNKSNYDNDLNSEPLLERKENFNKNNENKSESDHLSNFDSLLNENIKIAEEQNIKANENIINDSNSIEIKGKKKENLKIKEIEQRKSLKSIFMEKIIHKILSLEEKEKEKIKPNKKYFNDDLLLLELKEKRKKDKNHLNIMDNLITEEPSFNLNATELQYKKKTIIKGILDLKKENEWNKFIEEYQKEKEGKKFSKKLKALFNINSDFMVLWKKSFSIFYMIILYLFFFKYVFLELPKLNGNETAKKRILYLYRIINLMFAFDLILSIIIIIHNGGSLFTYLKLPLKIYMIIPFSLKSKNIPFLMPKFCRIDLFKRVFDSIEQFIVVNITHNIHNYHMRNFIIYTNRMFTYLLEFGLYAHFTSCIFSHLDDVKYVSSLYYTIETITTIGFGEISPKSEYSLLIGIFNLYMGINLFTIMSCNVKYLTTKLYTFSREMSLKQRLEFLVFKIQNGTGRIFPFHLKKLITFFILFRRGLSYKDIKVQYEPTLKVCRNKMIKSIRKSLLSFLRKEFSLCFSKCEKQFVNSLLEVLKPKIFKANKAIINYGQKVKYLYFLVNGKLFAYDRNSKPIFTIFNTAMFCEYEFITGTTSDFIIKVHPKIPAYGFIITKEDWDLISEKYISSVKNFIDLSYKKRVTHLDWLDKSYKNKVNLEIINNENVENINNIIGEDKLKLKKNNKIKNVNRKNDRNIPLKNKGDRHKLNNMKIITKINDLNKEMQFLELSVIKYKQKVYEFFSNQI